MKKFLILILLFLPLTSFGASLLRLNEFSTGPTGWVELYSYDTTVDLTGWKIEYLVDDELGVPTTTTTVLNTLLLTNPIIPAGGLASFNIDLSTSSNRLVLYDNSDPAIATNCVAFGGLTCEVVAGADIGTGPLADQSAYVPLMATGGGGPWNRTDASTRNWFNQSPTKPSVLDAIASSSVTTNLTVDDDWTNVTGLSLESADHGRLVWSGPLNLTGSADRTILQNLGTSINFDTGAISGGGMLSSASSTFTSLAPVVVPPVVPPSGGGSSGGGGGGGSAPADTATTTPLVGRVLGVNTFKFIRQMKFGMRGADIGELQKRLKLEGFYLANVGSIFNGATKKAVIKYQQKYKIKPASGVVGKLTLAQLNKNTGGEAVVGDVKSKIAELLKQIALLKNQLASIGALR
ncbi:MAG: peptidoglycan-binding domain-containing protein [Candidatus Vogelbacteria bacterium]|nr:peptidoglycan-binding domain-containing protein [Candidatus Vogelbacteria bacterium]